MGYQPNVVNQGDIIYINGVRFRAKYDFNLAKGDKNLLLKREDKPHTYIAYSGLGVDGCKSIDEMKERNNL